MSDVALNTYNLKRYAQRIGIVNSRINKLDGRLDSLYKQVGLLGLYNLIQADALTCFSWRLVRCQLYLNQTASDFENAEKLISQFDPLNFKLPNSNGHQPDNHNSNGDIWPRSLKEIQRLFRLMYGPSLVGFGAVESALWMLGKSNWNAFWNGELSVSSERSLYSQSSEDGKKSYKVFTGTASASAQPEYGNFSKDEDVIEQTKTGHGNLQDEKWYDKKGTILEAGATASITGSVIEGHLEGDNGWAEGSLDAKLLTAEAHASAEAGFYVYEADKNGNIKRIFSPGVSAEVGASVAVAQVEAEGRIGLGEDKKMLGLYGDVEAKALTAEAKAGVSINREEVRLGASAEADLVKVSAAGGVSLLGTDVGVTGSLKVGVGAHANVGYSDGKFKFDVGAAVGVGFDVGFEIDVSGTVDAVCDIATSALDGLSNAASGVANTVSSAWNWLFG